MRGLYAILNLVYKVDRCNQMLSVTRAYGTRTSVREAHRGSKEGREPESKHARKQGRENQEQKGACVQVLYPFVILHLQSSVAATHHRHIEASGAALLF